MINPDPPALLHHPTLRNIVVTHGVAPGFATWAGREAGEAELRGNVLDTRFDYVALGHVHLRGNPGINAWYSGSTERTSWGDQAAQPGYALVTLARPRRCANGRFRRPAGAADGDAVTRSMARNARRAISPT